MLGAGRYKPSCTRLDSQLWREGNVRGMANINLVVPVLIANCGEKEMLGAGRI